MIKAKVVTLTIEEAIGNVTKLDLETYIDNKESAYQNFVFRAMPWEGLDVVIMTEEEYKALDSVSDVLRKSLLDEREKTKKLEEENKDLKKKVERLKEELFFFYKGLKYNETVSELEKEVEKLEKSKSDMWLERNTLKAENERLQKKIENLERSKKALDDEYIRRVSENMALEKKLERLQDAAEVNIHTDGPIIFIQLEEENKDLKKDDEVKLKISDEFTLNITSGLFYKKD